MNKKTNKTIIERFGFGDKDLTTPEHDKILLWCMKKDNIYRMLSELGIIKPKQIICTCNKYNYDWKNEEREQGNCDWNENYNNECEAGCIKMPEFNDYRIETIHDGDTEKRVNEKWKNNKEYGEEYHNECKKTLSRRETIIRMIISEFESINQNTKERLKKIFIDDCITEVVAEYAIMGGYNDNHNIGFIDLFVAIERKGFYPFSFSLFDEHKQIFIEIKPEVKSIGELIRQINMYRSHMNNTIFIVVTKTRGLKDILSSQNIFVFEYDGGTLNDFK